VLTSARWRESTASGRKQTRVRFHTFDSTISVILVLARFQKKYGHADTYALLTTIVASPHVDPLTAILAIDEVANRFGLASLRYDNRFPACLLTSRPAGFAGLPDEVSVVRALVEGSTTIGADDYTYIVLVGLLTHFREGAFWGGVSIALRETPNLHQRKARRLRELLDGVGTPDAALAAVGIKRERSSRQGKRR